jgi:hypothetical protein
MGRRGLFFSEFLLCLKISASSREVESVENRVAAPARSERLFVPSAVLQSTEALRSLFAADPILLPQGQPAITGTRAIRSLYQSFFKDVTVKGPGEVVAAEVSGDLG